MGTLDPLGLCLQPSRKLRAAAVVRLPIGSIVVPFCEYLILDPEHEPQKGTTTEPMGTHPNLPFPVCCVSFVSLALYLISISIFLAPSLAGTPPYECLRNFISQGLKGSTMGIYGVFIRCLTRFHAGAVCVGSIS